MNSSGAKENLVDSTVFTRQAHLSLLGIQQWYSRYRLSHAGKTPETLYAKSGVVHLDGLAKEPQPSVSEKYQRSQSPPVIPEKHHLEKFTEQLSSVKSNVSIEETVSDTPLSEVYSTVSDLTLSLCMVSAGSALVFYEGHESELQTKTQNFLKAFLRFVIEGSHKEFDSRIFEWPVFSSAVLRTDQLRYFNETISRWASKAGWVSVQYVFYFGYHFEALEQQLLDIKMASGSESIFVPIGISLGEILSAPVKKRALWESIAALTPK